MNPVPLFLIIVTLPLLIGSVCNAELRTWTSIVGTKVEAELVSLTGNQVTLKTKAGKTLKLPLNKLSKADQEFLTAKTPPKEPTKEEAPVNSNLKYEVRDSEVTITGCDKKAWGELTIPATIEGKAVTNIGFAAFNRCDSLMRVTIPDTVTSIGGAAFLHCGSLANVTIGAGVTYIGDNAFNSCVSLTGITLPDTLTRISEGAFYNCRLTSITIPDGVTSIGEMTFGACRDLTSVTFLGKPPKEGKEVFKDSTPTIYRKPEAKGWGETWGGRPVKLISEKLIAENTPVEPKSFSLHLKYEIKDDAVTITGCDKKASGELTIPATIEGRAVTSIGMDAFTGCTSLKNITLPDGLTSIGDRAFCACKSLTSIIIPDSVTSIGGDAFIGCASLKNITIPDSVTSIGNSAFTGCASLTSITIPDSVTSIGYGVFLLCKSLTSITIPDSVTSIGDQAFYGCRSLTSITIPDSVTSIEKKTFYDCKSLTAVTFLGDAPKAGQHVFLGTSPTIYRKPEEKGWGDTFAGRPVKLISEKP